MAMIACPTLLDLSDYHALATVSNSKYMFLSSLRVSAALAFSLSEHTWRLRAVV